MFQYGETKQFVRKIVIPTHCLILNISRYQKFSKTQKGFSTNFSIVWDRKLLTEIVKIFPPLTHLSIECFDITFFWNTEGFPMMFFDTARYQLFDGKVWWPLFFYPQNFSMPEFFWKIQRDHLQCFLALWDRMFPTEISHLLFLFKRCFDTRFFLNHRMFPLRCFLILWDINFPTDSCDVPCFFYP